VKKTDPPPDRPPRPRSNGTAAKDKEPAEHYVRRLARDHCRGAMRALAAVAKDTESPASARITAATSLVAWALGFPADAAPSPSEIGSGKRAASEQVVRLAWMDSKNQKRGKAVKPKSDPGTTATGKEIGDKRGR
jgi:hypothetical protein